MVSWEAVLAADFRVTDGIYLPWMLQRSEIDQVVIPADRVQWRKVQQIDKSEDVLTKLWRGTSSGRPVYL